MKEMQEQKKRIKTRMAKIKHKLAILSGKGGVGKSTVAANLALALARKGYKVGVLDADITGPSIPKILGVRGKRLTTESSLASILPASGPLGIKVISMDFLLPDDETPVIWRGPMKSMAIIQFLADVEWGDLDFLLIDLPPGSSDEPLTIMQTIPSISGIVIVTAPSEVSQIVVKRAIGFTKELRVPPLGIIENYSGFVCPKCGAEFDILGSGGGQKIAEQLGVPFLGKIPIDPRICEDSDRGTPFVLEHAETPAAKAFMRMVEKIEEFLKRQEART
ncbi:MAG: ATP-binding protein [Hadesarchaea archaeon]|nr:MAG: ATP-binding protein [Hadesarchaea archaeon]